MVATADERTWPVNEPILFLGEWCKRFSRKKKWLNNFNATLNYHWDDREKLRKDFNYLQELHEILLKDLSKQLNIFHNSNYSIRYWRILIGPWLGYFIQIIFDRWSTLNNALNDYDINKCYILDRKPFSFVPKDMQNFNNLSINDDWNEFIFGKLLQSHTEAKIDIIPVNGTNDEPISIVKKISDRWPKVIFKKIISIYSGLITRKNDHFFIISHIPIFTQIALQIRLKQIPSLWFSSQLEYCDLNLNQRNWVMDNSNSADKFIEAVCMLIPTQIPIAYLEGFSTLKNYVNKSR